MIRTWVGNLLVSLGMALAAAGDRLIVDCAECPHEPALYEQNDDEFFAQPQDHLRADFHSPFAIVSQKTEKWNPTTGEWEPYPTYSTGDC